MKKTKRGPTKAVVAKAIEQKVLIADLRTKLREANDEVFNTRDDYHRISADLTTTNNKLNGSRKRVESLTDEVGMLKAQVHTEKQNVRGLMVLIRALSNQEDKMVTMQLDIMPQIERLLEQVQKEEGGE